MKKHTYSDLQTLLFLLRSVHLEASKRTTWWASLFYFSSYFATDGKHITVVGAIVLYSQTWFFITQVYRSDRRNRLFSLFSDKKSDIFRWFSVGSVEFRRLPNYRIPAQISSEKFRKISTGTRWKLTKPIGTDRNLPDEIRTGIL